MADILFSLKVMHIIKEFTDGICESWNSVDLLWKPLQVSATWSDRKEAMLQEIKASFVFQSLLAFLVCLLELTFH